MDEPTNDAEFDRKIKALYDLKIKIVTASFSQAKAYFNLVIVGGYAAFFALWKLTEDLLGDEQRRWSGLLMATSVAIFVAWEISQMVYTTQSLIRQGEVLGDFENFQERIQELGRKEQQKKLRIMKLWAVALFATISTAIAAAGILMWAFFSQLVCGC